MLVVWRSVQGLMGPAALGLCMGLDQALMWLCVGTLAQRLACDLAPCGITSTRSST